MRRPEFTGDDSYEMAEAFAGKRWTELSVETLFYHRESLAALNASSYRAYIGAYLLAAIASQDPLDRHGADIRHYLVASLEPGVHATERLQELTNEQRVVVRDVLRSLDALWKTPAAATAADSVDTQFASDG